MKTAVPCYPPPCNKAAFTVPRLPGLSSRQLWCNRNGCSSFTLTHLSLEAEVCNTSESPSYLLKKKPASKVGGWKGRENLIPLMVNKLFSKQEPRPKLLLGDPIPVKSGPCDRTVTSGWIWKVSLTQWEKDQNPVPRRSLPHDCSKWTWTLWLVRHAPLPRGVIYPCFPLESWGCFQTIPSHPGYCIFWI